jgi:hypothetical protein
VSTVFENILARFSFGEHAKKGGKDISSQNSKRKIKNIN